MADNPRPLAYRLEHEDRVVEYGLSLVFDVLGFRSQASAGPCDLYYGSCGGAPGGALVIEPRPSDVLWPEALQGRPIPDDGGRVFPFDVINAVTRLVTDEVNRNLAAEACDEHQRVRFSASFQGRHDIGETPVVNAYATILGHWLRRRFRVSTVPAWPVGKHCAIGLSHDVDWLARWSRTLVWPLYARHLGRYANLMVAKQRAWQVRQLLRHPQVSDFSLLRQAAAFEAALGCSSTFFFAARNRFQEHGSLLDVPYDVTTRPMRRLTSELLEQGFGVGLHASYRAYEAPDRFADERNLLRTVSGGSVPGLRHHFWHMGSDVEATLACHERAGFEYDTSIAFNEHLGFRRSVAWPYYPWNRPLGRPVTTLQLPVFCMDGNLFYHSSSVDDAIDKIARIVQRLKTVGGIGVVDWHSDTISPRTPGYQAWGLAYARLVRLLADDSGIWTTNLETIAEWFDSRRRSLASGGP